MKTTGIPYLDKAWNPCGFGCSKGCDGCWAKAMAPRMSAVCQYCADFRVHLHKERLDWPSRRRKPCTILVNFTCDTFDAFRPRGELARMLAAADAAPQHTFIWLTKNPELMAIWAEGTDYASNGNWYFGVTIRDQADWDAKRQDFLSISGKKWISYEPAQGGVDWSAACSASSSVGLVPICGIIVGHDNRRGAPGTDTLDHIYSTVAQCAAAGVAAYVKQLWIDGTLRHRPEYFPEELRLRQLPWATDQSNKGKEANADRKRDC